MKITDYEKIQNLVPNNMFLLDGDNGTKTIFASDMAKAMITLLSSKDFISGLNMSQLDQISELTSDAKLLVGTSSGNKAISKDALFAPYEALMNDLAKKQEYSLVRTIVIPSTELPNTQGVSDWFTIGEITHVGAQNAAPIDMRLYFHGVLPSGGPVRSYIALDGMAIGGGKYSGTVMNQDYVGCISGIRLTSEINRAFLQMRFMIYQTNTSDNLTLYIYKLLPLIHGYQFTFLETAKKETPTSNGVQLYSEGLLPTGTISNNIYANHMSPLLDNTSNLGSASRRWNTGYFGSSPIVSSDMFEKMNIRTLDPDTATRLITELDPVEYYRHGDSKKHYGFLAQQLEYALSKCGIDPSTFAGLAIDDNAELVESGKYEEKIVIDENSNEQKTNVPIMKSVSKGEIYGIRYEELIPPLYAVVKKYENRIAALENAFIQKFDEEILNPENS